MRVPGSSDRLGARLRRVGVLAFALLAGAASAAPARAANPSYDLALTQVLAFGQPSTVAPGAAVDYVIVVRNQGDVGSGAFRVMEYVPFEMTFDVAENPGWTLSGSGNAQWIDGATILPGGTRTIFLRLRLRAGTVPSIVTSRAEIRADSSGTGDRDSVADNIPGNDVVGGDNVIDNANGDEDDHDPAPITVVAAPDAALIARLASGQATSVPAGGSVAYQITVLNQGNVDLANVGICAYLPTATNVVAADNPGWTVAPGIARFTLAGPVASGASANIALTLAVDAARTAGQMTVGAETCTLTADVDSVPDANPLNDVVGGDDVVNGANGDEDDHDIANATVLAAQRYDLALVKRLLTTGPVLAGDLVRFAIDVRNQGDVAAAAVDVVDYLPQGLTFSAADNPGWTASGALARRTLPGALAPRASTTVEIALRVDRGAGGSLVNAAEIASDDGADADSTPDAITGNDVVGGDDVVNGANGDEDDHDIAAVTVASARGSLSIGNLAFVDANGNGIHDTGEVGMPAIAVTLYTASGTKVGVTVTNSAGGYLFTGLVPGAYIVEAGVPAGYSSSQDASSSGDPDGNVDGDDNGVTTSAGAVRSRPVTLSVGHEPTGETPVPGIDDPSTDANANGTVDFGFYPGTTLSLRIAANRSQVRRGQRVRLVFTVRNIGSVRANRIRVCSRLTSRFAYVRLGGASLQNGRACWTLRGLAAGGRKGFKLIARPSRSTRLGRVLTRGEATATNARPARAVRAVIVKPGR